MMGFFLARELWMTADRALNLSLGWSRISFELTIWTRSPTAWASAC